MHSMFSILYTLFVIYVAEIDIIDSRHLRNIRVAIIHRLFVFRDTRSRSVNKHTQQQSTSLHKYGQQTRSRSVNKLWQSQSSTHIQNSSKYAYNANIGLSMASFTRINDYICKNIYLLYTDKMKNLCKKHSLTRPHMRWLSVLWNTTTKCTYY